MLLIATLRSAPGREAELEAALRTLVAPTANEPGVLEYRLNRSRTEPGTYRFIERFADQAALDAHMAAPHVQSVFARFDALLDGPPEIDMLDPLDGFHRPDRA